LHYSTEVRNIVEKGEELETEKDDPVAAVTLYRFGG